MNPHLPPDPGPAHVPPKRPLWQVIVAVTASVVLGAAGAVGLLLLVLYGLVWVVCSKH